MYSNNITLSVYGTELPFRQSIAKIPSERTAQDVTIIHGYLKNLEALSSFRESNIRHLCKTIRYEVHDSNHVLFSRSELNTCWYILLSGSVFIESTMYLPRASFGKRTPNNPYRINECVVLEPSEMLVIDYPELDHVLPNHDSLKRIAGKHSYQREQSVASTEEQQSISMDSITATTANRKKNSQNKQRSTPMTNTNDIPASMTRSSHSRASDTSSAYSGSDVMQSSTNGEDCLMLNNVESCSGLNDDGGLSRCLSIHESDDESETSSEHSFPLHDHIRESLVKDASERTDDDIEAILDCLIHFPAFANLTLHVRRELCKVLVYAQVEKAQTIVMNDGERYDSWSVIINGIVDDETVDGQLLRTLTVGESFGCGPTLDQYCHAGIMKTRVDNCQFVVVAQNDYYAILNQGEKNIRKVEENDKIVLVKEIRITEDEQHVPREVVIKATTDKLLDLLVDEQQFATDPNYVQDFLLTYRTFINDPTVISNKLLYHFDRSKSMTTCEHIARIVLSWVNYHYNDFETNSQLNEFLGKFDELLYNHNMENIRLWSHLINLACYTKASVRNITLTRSTRDDMLNFNIIGGSDTSANNGIFILKVEKNSKAYEVGLKRGDQILSVNSQSFDYLTHNRALEVLRGSTHLCLTVKNNLMGLNDIIHPEKSPTRKKRQDISSYEKEIRSKLNNLSPTCSTSLSPQLSTISVPSTMSPNPSLCFTPDGTTAVTTNPFRPPLSTITPTKNNLSAILPEEKKPRPLKKRMNFKRSVFQKFGFSRPNSELDTSGGDNGLDSSITLPNSKALNRSSSNPDLSPSSMVNKSMSSSTSGPIGEEDQSTFVLKIYRSDQSYKYFPVHKETKAKEVVMLAISEFGIGEASSNNSGLEFDALRQSIFSDDLCYSLCEVSFENGVIKQKRLPDHTHNLPARLPVNARYYLKNNHSTETLVPDNLSNDLLREGRITFLQLDALEICAQLTLRDFALFKSIQTTEYIDHVFKLKSTYGVPQLEKFLKLPNQEMYWTITEIVHENNIIQRSKVIKHFLKIAKCCKEMKNFNSMFAIVSGLDHKSVQRLQSTWERVPEKYKTIFEELKSLLDLSRNMSVYRNLLKNEYVVPPIIPMFPVCMKDLTFIHLGNETQEEGLINFEKLRMIAKEIRHITNMASSPYDISNMLDSPTSYEYVFAGFGHQSVTDSFGTMRRQHNNRGFVVANARRIYDSALMVKKVRTYLNTAEIIEDENRLLDMANQCEPIGGESTFASPSAPFPRISFAVDKNEYANVSTPTTSKEHNQKDAHANNEATSTTIENKTAIPFDNNSNSNNKSTPATGQTTTAVLGAIKARLLNVSTLKRRPSPSTSSISSNSSCDRRAGSAHLAKFGTQSPDAVNKLLRLSDSSHQVKSRIPYRQSQSSSNSPFNLSVPHSTSTLVASRIVTTPKTSGLTSGDSAHSRPHVAKIRDTNKLTSESSSLNFKQPASTSHPPLVRSNTQYSQTSIDFIKDLGGDSGRASINSTDTCTIDGSEKSTSTISDGFSSVKIRNRPPLPQSTSVTSGMRNDSLHVSKSMRHWLQRSQSETEAMANDVPDRDETVDFDEHEQVTAV